MSEFTGKIGGAGAGLIVPGFWEAEYTPVVITDPAFVRGLEAKFTFAGLTLNDLSNPDRYRLSKIDGLYDAEIRDPREVNSSRHGEISFDSLYSGRTLALTGTIHAGNLAKLRNMEFDLQSAFHSLITDDLVISFPNETDTYLTCKKSAAIDFSEVQENRRPQRNFMVTLRADDPRFYSTTNVVTITPASIVHVGRNYNEEFNRDYDGYPLLDQITVNNHGSAINYPDIKFFGSLKNFVIINYTTGDILKINTNISSPDYYYYNQNTMELVDSVGQSRISALDISGSLIPLVPGDNVIGFGGETYDVNAKVEIYAKSSWI